MIHIAETAGRISGVLGGALLLVSCGGSGNGYDATGTFEAEEITVSAEMNGKVELFNVEDGQEVSPGEVLGNIDTLQLHLRKRQLESNLLSVRYSRPDIDIQTAPVREQLAKQKAEKERTGKLLESGAATRKQYDDMVSSISVLEGQLSAAESSLRKNIASLDAQAASLASQIAQVEDQITRCIISSPVQGTVLSRYIHAGELAVTGKPLFRVADVKNMYLRAYFTLGQLADVTLGQKVKVYADFGGGNIREYEGAVVWISDKSEFTPKSIQTADDRENLVYAVKIAVRNDGYIKIGMYGEVRL